MTNQRTHFRSELKWCYDFWERTSNKVSEEIQRASETWKRVDGKPCFTLGDPSDGTTEALNFADPDFFPNIHKFLISGAASPIGSTEAERAERTVIREKVIWIYCIYNEHQILTYKVSLRCDTDTQRTSTLKINSRKINVNDIVLEDCHINASITY